MKIREGGEGDVIPNMILKKGPSKEVDPIENSNKDKRNFFKDIYFDLFLKLPQ